MQRRCRSPTRSDEVLAGPFTLSAGARRQLVPKKGLRKAILSSQASAALPTTLSPASPGTMACKPANRNLMHTLRIRPHPSDVTRLVTVSAVPKSPVVPPCAEVGAGPAAAPCAQPDRKWILIAIILGSSLAFMDGSVVNVALPTLQSTFHATSAAIQWVVQSYALFGAALLLLGGAIGDRYGRRRTFLWGVALFALASAACAASHSLGQLIAARAIQGVGAALLVPQGLSILSASFPEQERGRAIGTWSAWTSVFAALGPVAGGWLMQAWSWRLIFLLNLPFVLLIMLLAPRIPESRALGDGSPAQPLDRLGAALATLSFAAIIYALSFAPQLGWRNCLVSWPLLGGLVLFALFLRSQSSRPNAMMPLSLFRIPRFLAPNLLTFLLYGALGGSLYVIPFYLIQVRHYPPAAAGAVFLPLILLMFLFSARVGALVPRVGERLLLCAGAAAGRHWLCRVRLARRAAWIRPVRSARRAFPWLRNDSLRRAAHQCRHVFSAGDPNRHSLRGQQRAFPARRAAGCLPACPGAGPRICSPASATQLGPFQPCPSRLATRCWPTGLACTISRSRRPYPGAACRGSRCSIRAFLAGFRSVMLACAFSAWAGGLAVLLCCPYSMPNQAVP